MLGFEAVVGMEVGVGVVGWIVDKFAVDDDDEEEDAGEFVCVVVLLA